MAFKYRQTSKAQLQADAEQSGGGYASIFKDGVPEFKPKKGGEYTFRIAPPTGTLETYADTLFVNYGIGPDEESFVSRRKLGFEDDPVAEMHDRLRRHGTEYEEQLKRQAPKKRRPMWVYVRGEETKGWQAWSCPWTVHKDISKKSVRKKKGTYLFIDHPDKGHDVTLSRESTGFGTYSLDEIDPDSSPIDENPKRQKELLDFLDENPINEQYQIYSYDEIKRRCDGNTPPDEDVDEDEDIPATRSQARAKAEPVAEVSDDEPVPELIDDPDADIDEDDTSPPPPPPPKAKRAGVRRGPRAKG